MPGVDSVRRQSLRAQLTNNVPWEILHVGNVRLATGHRICVREMPHPMVLVVVPVFKLLRADHTLKLVLSVALKMNAKCVARLELMATDRTDITGILLAVILVQLAQRGIEERPGASFPHSTRKFAFIIMSIHVETVQTGRFVARIRTQRTPEHSGLIRLNHLLDVARILTGTKRDTDLLVLLQYAQSRKS